MPNPPKTIADPTGFGTQSYGAYWGWPGSILHREDGPAVTEMLIIPGLPELRGQEGAQCRWYKHGKLKRRVTFATSVGWQVRYA